MAISFDLLPELIGYSILMGIIYFLLYYRYIYSIVDPLITFVITCGFGSVLVIEALDDPKQVIHFFVCQLCVFIGFAWVQQRTGNPALRKVWQEVDVRSDIALLRSLVYVFLAIYLLSNLFLFYTKGIALLSDTPSSDKVTNYQGGFGLFRKINLAIGGVASTGLTFLYLDRMRKHDLVWLIVMMLVGSLEGSKGALVRYVLCFSMFLYHPAFRHRRDLLKRLQRLAPLALVGVFGVFFTVLFRENSTTDEALLAFVRRLLYGADVILFYYQPANVDYFARFSAWDYPSYVLNPIVGFFRLTPYQEAFGNVMVENSLPPGVTLDVILGPNSPFYTEGQIFFGYYGAFFYSLLVGALTSYLRALYFSLVKCSAFMLVLMNVITLYSLSFLTDVRMTVGMLFDTILFVVPLYVVISLLIRHRFVIRRIRFSLSR